MAHIGFLDRGLGVYRQEVGIIIGCYMKNRVQGLGFRGSHRILYEKG